MQAIPEIIEEHLDEAGFFWRRWEQALVAPDYDLAETASVEERLLAHLDGLVVAGPDAEPLLTLALESEEATRISAAAFVLLAGQDKGPDEILARLRSSPPKLRPPLERALELSGSEQLNGRLLPLLDASGPGIVAAALRVLAVRDTVPAALLEPLMVHEAPEVRMAALAAAASHSPKSFRPGLLQPHLASVHPGIRAAAIETGLAWNLRTALVACRELVQAGGRSAREAMLLLALSGAGADAAFLASACEKPQLRPDALWALGFTGHSNAAEACLPWMEDETVAALAGEAFSSITGLRISGPFALPPVEEREEPIPLEEEALDADLVPKPEDALLRPDARAVQGWWKQNGSRFQRGTRYLNGRPLDAETLLEALESGPMRRRHAWARELTIRSRATCRVRTSGPARRQRNELVRARAAIANIHMLPLERLLG